MDFLVLSTKNVLATLLLLDPLPDLKAVNDLCHSEEGCSMKNASLDFFLNCLDVIARLGVVLWPH